MSPIVRAWVAFAALGAGLIHLALVLGSPPAFAVAFGVIGLAEFAWGIVALARDPLAPRAALVLALVPVLGLAALAAVGAMGGMRGALASTPFLALAVASLLELFIAAALGAHLRRGDRPPAGAPGTARYLLGVAAGALVVAALTTTALGVTQAGLSAVPHGELEEPGHDAPVHPDR